MTASNKQPIILLELTCLNFDMIRQYINAGYLPNFQHLLNQHPLLETKSDSSQTQYDQPWNQWLSARTGQTYSEHQLTHLGEITQHENIKQHWETLEEMGYKVAALCPMNAANRTHNAPFWLPDPWTNSVTSGPEWLETLAQANQQGVNDNADENLEQFTRNILISIFATKSRKQYWPFYAKNAFNVICKSYQWSKTLFFERLHADIFYKLWRKHQPDFATLGLNGCLQVQNFYWFNASMYKGNQTNPDWYVPNGIDPVLAAYQTYDHIIGDLLKLNARLMIATAGKQIPKSQATYCYRLFNHQPFLKKLGVPNAKFRPGLWSDFCITTQDEHNAQYIHTTLQQLTSDDGVPIFEDTYSQGCDVFASLTYPYVIDSPFPVRDNKGKMVIRDLAELVLFKGLHNTHFDAQGYYIDTGLTQATNNNSDNLTMDQLYNQIMNHFE